MAQLLINSTGTTVAIQCGGSWRATELERAATILDVESAGASGRHIVFELSHIDAIDVSGALLLQRAGRKMTEHGADVRYVGASKAVEQLLAMTRRYSHPDADFTPEVSGVLESVGRQSAELFHDSAGTLAFIGQTSHAILRALLFRGQLRIRELAYQIMESAVKALGIIALTMFLVGVVVAYQSAVQLKTYGANIFIVDALGISILRELAPMLTAIVIAGRSGSSYAAQIGVMKMTEEIDAMRTMGFDPYTFLVVPRMLALILTLPMLIFFADIFGLLGGMVIANTELGLSAAQFLDRFVEAVALKHFWVGLIKGPFFGVLIASIGIYRGLQVKNDTESIGINTTKSVVETIFAIIICDALFSIVFTTLGF
jgi:phospholipid/cholesterol/gamma-HCH transport system permease protein